jgi:1-acyl-sn-glycerol-3-phosphate acyltransferase
MFAVAPEGTRNPEGKLQRGKAGVVLLAQRSGAPIQPVVHHGDIHWQEKLKRFRRVPFNIEVGPPFRISKRARPISSSTRQAITDEIMLQMARLLPEDYRGVYAGRKPTMEYLEFI